MLHISFLVPWDAQALEYINCYLSHLILIAPLSKEGENNSDRDLSGAIRLLVIKVRVNTQENPVLLFFPLNKNYLTQSL